VTTRAAAFAAIAATAAIAGLAACSHVAPATEMESFRGTVVITGTAQEPFVTVQRDDGAAHIVQGPLAEELHTLAGALVDVRGAIAGSGIRSTIAVESYDIVEIAGRRPLTGTILTDGRLATATDTLYLSGGGSELRQGLRVWIVGERTGDRLAVSSWGRIGR
jgi:hypothetical protein